MIIFTHHNNLDKFRRLVIEIELAEKEFQDLLYWKPFENRRDWNKRRMFVESRLGALYKELMVMVEKGGLWNIYYNNNSISIIFSKK